MDCARNAQPRGDNLSAIAQNLVTELEQAFTERSNLEGRRLSELWDEERPQLMALPPTPFEVSEPVTLEISSRALVRVEAVSAERNLADRPLNDSEDKILRIIQKAGGGDPDPYEPISLEEVDEHGWAVVNSAVVSQLITLYLDHEPTNYPRLAWLLRRLTQVSAPGALKTVVMNLERLSPVIGDAARYIKNASTKVDNAGTLGADIVNALSIPLVTRNPYLTVVLLNLFSQQPTLNHLDRLLPRYESVGPAARRELILAASAAKAGYWIKERKGEFASGSDAWLRRALIAASSCLSGDEGEHWLRKLKPGFSLLERLVAKWAPTRRSFGKRPPKIHISFDDDK